MAKSRLRLLVSGPRRSTIASMAMAMAMAMASGASWAAEWTNSKEIAVGGVYTDNLFLTDDDTESDWATLVTPGIVLRGTGRNLKLDLAYALQYVNYASGKADDKFYNRLQLKANSELVQDHFFLDARATVGQGLVNAFGPSGGDVINPTGNVQNVYTYSVAPVFKNRFRTDAELTARYENYGVFYSKDGDNSIGNKIDVDLHTGPSFGKTRLGAILSNDYINYERGANKRLTNVGGLGEYQFNRRIKLGALVGYEDNDIDAVSTDTNGPRWEISGTWTPNVRTLLNLGIGRRFFGWTPLLTFQHRSKRSLWTASYRRDLSSAATERGQSNVFELENAQGEPILDPITGEPAEILPGEANPNSSSFVSDTFRTGYALETRRSKLGADAGYIRRDYENVSRDDTTALARIFWDRRLSPVTTANVSLGWSWRKTDDSLSQGASTKYTDWTLNIGVIRRLTERTEIGAWYRFRNRDSDRSGDDYQENRFNVAIRSVWKD